MIRKALFLSACFAFLPLASFAGETLMELSTSHDSIFVIRHNSKRERIEAIKIERSQGFPDPIYTLHTTAKDARIALVGEFACVQLSNGRTETINMETGQVNLLPYQPQLPSKSWLSPEAMYRIDIISDGLQVYDMETGGTFWRWHREAKNITQVAPADLRMYIISNENKLSVVGLETGGTLSELSWTDPIREVAVINESRAAFLDSRGTVAVYEDGTNAVIYRHESLNNRTREGLVASATVVAWIEERQAKLWQVVTQTESTINVRYGSKIQKIVLEEAGDEAAILFEDGTIIVYDTANGVRSEEFLNPW